MQTSISCILLLASSLVFGAETVDNELNALFRSLNSNDTTQLQEGTTTTGANHSDHELAMQNSSNESERNEDVQEQLVPVHVPNGGAMDLFGGVCNFANRNKYRLTATAITVTSFVMCLQSEWFSLEELDTRALQSLNLDVTKCSTQYDPASSATSLTMSQASAMSGKGLAAYALCECFFDYANANAHPLSRTVNILTGANAVAVEQCALAKNRLLGELKGGARRLKDQFKRNKQAKDEAHKQQVSELTSTIDALHRIRQEEIEKMKSYTTQCKQVFKHVQLTGVTVFQVRHMFKAFKHVWTCLNTYGHVIAFG